MKKILVLSLIFFAVPVYSACLVDGNSCSIANFQSETEMSTQSKSSTFSPTPSADRDPLKEPTISKPLRGFGQQESDYSYNSSCQFGVCNQTGAPKLFPNRSK
jgi:hypothetical protein